MPMKEPGQLLCMILFGGFVGLILHAKAQQAGGWGNFLGGCAMVIGLLVLVGVVLKGCRVIFGS